MTKISRALSLTLLPLLALSAPVAAQGSERVNIVVVYGDDQCPASVGDEIVVCPRLDEEERYRIPADLRGDPDSLGQQSWTNRVKAYEMVGASGAMSCSPSGAGGFTGCTQQLVNNYWAERESLGNVRAGQLVAEEREARLAELDGEADAEQARVDAAMAEQDRMRAERDADAGVTVESAELPLPQ